MALWFWEKTECQENQPSGFDAPTTQMGILYGVLAMIATLVSW
jgi:hypothetical protein